MSSELGLRQRKTKKRREEILHAALESFNELGFRDTKIEQIVELSGSSIGSIYHHFGGKEDVAAALYVYLVGEYRPGFLAALRSSDDAETSIKNLVRFQTSWLADNPKYAAYLLSTYGGEVQRLINEKLSRTKNETVAGINTWFIEKVRAGEIRRLSPEIFRGLISGATHEIVRVRLSLGQKIEFSPETVEILADNVWSSLRVKKD